MKQSFINKLSPDGGFIENPKGTLIGQYNKYAVIIKFEKRTFDITINVSRGNVNMKSLQDFLFVNIANDRHVRNCRFENSMVIIKCKKARNLEFQIVDILNKVTAFFSRYSMGSGCGFCGGIMSNKVYKINGEVRILCDSCYEYYYEATFGKKLKKNKKDKNIIDLQKNYATKDEEVNNSGIGGTVGATAALVSETKPGRAERKAMKKAAELEEKKAKKEEKKLAKKKGRKSKDIATDIPKDVVVKPAMTGIEAAKAATALGSAGLGAASNVAGTATALGSAGLGAAANVAGTATTLGSAGLGAASNVAGAATALGSAGLGATSNVAGAATALGSAGIGAASNVARTTTTLGSAGLGVASNVAGTATTLGAAGLGNTANATGAATRLGTIGLGANQNSVNTAQNIFQMPQNNNNVIQMPFMQNTVQMPNAMHMQGMTGMMPGVMQSPGMSSMPGASTMHNAADLANLNQMLNSLKRSSEQNTTNAQNLFINNINPATNAPKPGSVAENIASKPNAAFSASSFAQSSTPGFITKNAEEAKKRTDEIVPTKSTISPLIDNDEEEGQIKTKKRSTLTGVVGALTASVLGVLIWVLAYELQAKVANLDSIIEFAAVIMPILTILAYSKFCGTIKTSGIVYTVIITVLMMFFAINLTVALDISSENAKMGNNISLLAAFKAIPETIMENEVNTKGYIGTMVGSYLLATLVCIVAIYVLRKKDKETLL